MLDRYMYKSLTGARTAAVVCFFKNLGKNIINKTLKYTSNTTVAAADMLLNGEIQVDITSNVTMCSEADLQLLLQYPSTIVKILECTS